MPKTPLGIILGLPAAIFVGGIIFYLLGGLGEVLVRFFGWGDNLSIWGRVFIFVFIGTVWFLIYFKYLDPEAKKHG